MFSVPVLHTVREDDGTLIATYAEEQPLQDVTPPSDDKDGTWRKALEIDAAWRAECGPRHVKVAVPVMPSDSAPHHPTTPGTARATNNSGGSSSNAPPPVLIDVWIPPSALVTALNDSRSFDTQRIAKLRHEVPAPPDFLVYCRELQETFKNTSAASTVNDPALWVPEEFEHFFRTTILDGEDDDIDLDSARAQQPQRQQQQPVTKKYSTSSGTQLSSIRLRRRAPSTGSPTSARPDPDASAAAGGLSRFEVAQNNAADSSPWDEAAAAELGGSATAHGRAVDRHFHRTVAAFCRWAHAVLRRQQALAAERIVNDRFSFEYAAAIKPRLERGAAIVGVDTSSAERSAIYARLDLFAAGVSEHHEEYIRTVADIAESWSVAQTPDLDDDEDDENNEHEQQGAEASGASPNTVHAARRLALGVRFRVAITFTVMNHDSRSTPSTAPLLVTVAAVSPNAHHVNQNGSSSSSSPTRRESLSSSSSLRKLPAPERLADLFQRRHRCNPVGPPPPGSHDTLLDVLPALERHMLDTVIVPVARWLRLVGAFRAVFGPTISDVSGLAPFVESRIAQFLVVDALGPHQIAIVVSLTWHQPVPVVTYTSGQHMSPTGNPMTFSWVPATPAPSTDDPCGVAASAYAYLRDNFHKFVRVCEARGMHAGTALVAGVASR